MRDGRGEVDGHIDFYIRVLKTWELQKSARALVTCAGYPCHIFASRGLVGRSSRTAVSLPFGS